MLEKMLFTDCGSLQIQSPSVILNELIFADTPELEAGPSLDESVLDILIHSNDFVNEMWW